MNKKITKSIIGALSATMLLGATYSANGMSNFYGLVKGKYVRKVTINLKEGISYNKSKSTTTGNLIRLSKKNNPLQKSYGSWRWTYK